MDSNRTPAWWSTRVLLAVGSAAVLASTFLAWLMPVPFSFGDPRVELGPLLIPARFVSLTAALAVEIVGLIWMLRIARGPHDEPAPWRYRDR